LVKVVLIKKIFQYSVLKLSSDCMYSFLFLFPHMDTTQEKDREVKRQKELISKQAQVKAIRGNNNNTAGGVGANSKRFSGLGSSALGLKADASSSTSTGGANEFSLPSSRAAALDAWLAAEVCMFTMSMPLCVSILTILTPNPLLLVFTVINTMLSLSRLLLLPLV
jgi:hypothetical protein